MSALVDFPIDEAEALLKRTAPDGTCSMTAAECDAVDSARERLAKAVAVERGCGGKDSTLIAELAEQLIGQRVRIRTTYHSTFTGKLESVVGFRSLMIFDSGRRHPINASLVESIEVERAA